MLQKAHQAVDTHYMPLPSSVQVGPFTYEIQLDDQEDFGNHIGEELRIGIRKGLPIQLERETLLHEIFHAIFFSFGIKRVKEERVVEIISPILLDVIQRNPGLRAYLFD